MSEQESVVTEPSLPTPGQLLKEARQKKGLSLEQVANKLNLRAHNIEAIEGDEDDSNLSATFTKGYLKVYAKFVDVKESEILQAYEHINAVDKEPAKLQSFSRRVAKQTSDARLMMLTYFIITIVIALSVLWWFQQSDDVAVLQTPLNTPSLAVADQEESNVNTTPSQQNEQPAPIEEGVAQGSNTFADQANDLIETADNLETETDDIAVLVGDAIEGLTSEQPLPPVIDEVPGGNTLVGEDVLTETSDSVEQETVSDNFDELVELIFEFSDDCWVSVVDSTGETRAIGVKRIGYIMTVSGVPPFEVTLGAPQAVQISMAGEPVNMTRFPGGRTAKFELPLQE